MNRLTTATLFAVLSLASLPAYAQEVPELRPGETAFALDNCTIVYSAEEMKQWGKQRPDFKNIVWTGECRNGLVHGMGTTRLKGAAPAEQEAMMETFLGRRMAKLVQTYKDPSESMMHLTFRGEAVMFQNIGEDLQPKWGAHKSVLVVTSGANNWQVHASETICGVDPEKYKGCRGKGYTVYQVFMSNTSDGKNTAYYIDCPDPRTPVGCEPIWTKYGAGAIAGARHMLKIVAAAEEKTKAELIALNDPAQILQRRVMAAANKELEAKELAERQAAAAAAQKEADITVAKEQKLRAEAKEKAEREHKAKLAAMNAGQLFSLADQQKTEGKAGEARETLRTLISRFPDHALAATAAGMLAGLK